MGAQQDSKKVSISSSNPVVIHSNNSPVSEPSGKLYLAVVISLLGAIGKFKSLAAFFNNFILILQCFDTFK